MDSAIAISRIDKLYSIT